MEKLKIERKFNASVNKTWSAFTKPEMLEKWWAPEGMHAESISVDLRKGGVFGYCFVGKDNIRYWGRGDYQVIQEPNYFSYFDSFADEHGNPVPSSHYGIPGDEIMESLVEVKLSPENGHTKMEMVLDNYYDENMTEQMLKGWHGMFDKLDKIFKS